MFQDLDSVALMVIAVATIYVLCFVVNLLSTKE